MTAMYSTFIFYEPNRSERSQKNLAHLKPQKYTGFFHFVTRSLIFETRMVKMHFTSHLGSATFWLRPAAGRWCSGEREEAATEPKRPAGIGKLLVYVWQRQYIDKKWFGGVWQCLSRFRIFHENGHFLCTFYSTSWICPSRREFWIYTIHDILFTICTKIMRNLPNGWGNFGPCNCFF